MRWQSTSTQFWLGSPTNERAVQGLFGLGGLLVKGSRVVSPVDASAVRQDRTALITGAASGIGRATALRMAEDGYSTALIDMDADGLAKTAEAGALISDVWTRVCDLRQVGQISEAVGGALDHFGNLDVLINVAGVAVAGSTVDTDPIDWDRIVAVNLTAVFHTCRLVIPPMLRAGGGIIVNVSSVAGLVGLRQRAAYCATKHGVIGLTRAIAADHASQGIRANAICPGTVATEWIGSILEQSEDPEATRRAMEGRQLDGRMGTPEEVAAGIAFLVSKEGRFVSGSAFVMDGGMTAV
jgi:NAD(P)-dependent dehydrogenase (short-subunit alcohol dehydrogenase family)